MWKSVLNRVDKSEEATAKRKEEIKGQDESRPRRKDSGRETEKDKRDQDSIASPSTRKAPRGDDRGIDPTSVPYSPSSRGPAAEPSSYQTAYNYSDETANPDTYQNTRAMESGRSRGIEDDKKTRRRERSSSRDRKGNRRDRSRSEERVKGDKKEKKLKRRSTDTGMYSEEGSRAQTSRAVEDIAPATRPMSNHVPDMFPGQFPTGASAPYRPPLSVIEGGPGLASEYYNDGGQSVNQQPGIRPESPQVIVGSEPHLMTPAASAAPPTEPSSLGQVGAAASFYGQNSGNSTGSRPVAQSSQSLPYSNGSNSMGPTIGAAAAGLAAGYMMNSHTSQTSSHQTGSSSGRPSGPPYPTESNANSWPQKPGKQPHSNIPYVAAAGAAGLAAGAYYNHEHNHEHNHSGHQNGGSYNDYNTGSSSQNRRSGPLDKLVDFFRDPEGVARFEEYSEAAGFCRGCFEPGSTARQAPRRHNFKARRSSEKLRPSRVDKDNRYYVSSDGEGRRKSNKSLLGAAAATIGLASVARTLTGDFDDTYSIKSGKYQKSSSAPRRSSAEYRRGSYSDRDDRRSKKSKKTVEYGIAADGGVFRKSNDTGSGTIDRITVERSRSRSSSNDRRKLRNAAIGAATGAALASAATSRVSPGNVIRVKHRSRSRSRSDERRSRRRQSPVQSSSIFGRFFSPTSSNRDRKSKGFFTFSNDSSSSGSSLAYDASDRDSRRRNKRSSPKIKTAAEANAALIGLGTAAAALAAHENRNRKSGKPSVVAVKSRTKQSDSRHRHATAEDGWESASEFSDSSTDSALAFGSPFNRSRESLAEKGTDKWDWRWGQKKQRPSSPRYETPKRDSGLISPAAAGLAGVAAGALANEALKSRDSRTARDHGRDPIIEQDYHRGRPEPVPIQQPQPIVPVPSAVYQSRDPDGAVLIQPKSPRNRDDGVRFDLTRDQAQRHRDDEDYRTVPGKSRFDGPSSSQVRDSVIRPGPSKRADFVLVEPGKPKVAPEEREIQPDEFDAEQFAELQAELARLRAYRALKLQKAQQGVDVKGKAAFALAGMAAASVAAEAKKTRENEEEKSGSKPAKKAVGGWAGLVSALADSKKGVSKDPPAKTEESQTTDTTAAKIRIARAPSPVAHEDYASYFAPDILSKPAKAKETNPDPNAGVDLTTSRDGLGLNLRGRMSEPEFPKIENEEFDSVESHRGLPWRVPRLGLINPTPPGSRNPSAQPSPMIQPRETSIAEEEEEDIAPISKPDASKKPVYSVITPKETTRSSDEPSALRKLEDISDIKQKKEIASPVEEGKRKSMPGDFEDDIDFAATLAAGTAAAGFDPNIVIEDPTYRRRDSPPGSQSKEFYRQPYYQTVSDVGLETYTKGNSSTPRDFVEGEIPDTPKDDGFTKPSNTKKDSKADRKEQRKKDKAAKRYSLEGEEAEIAASVYSTKDIDRDRVRDSTELEIIEDMARDTQTEPDTPVPKKEKKKSKASDPSNIAAIALAAMGGAATAKIAEDPIEIAPKSAEKKAKKSSGFDIASLAFAAASDASQSRTKNADADPELKSKKSKSRSSADVVEPFYSKDNDDPLSSSTRSIKDESKPENDDVDEIFDSTNEYAPSTYTASVGGYDDEDGSRKHKKKSKRRSKNFDDDASTAVLVAKADDAKDSGKQKDKKGGLFGIFSKVTSNESNEKRGSKDTPVEPEEEIIEPKKKKKSRKSRDADDFYSIASASAADVSKLDDEEDDRKSRRRRSRRDTIDDDDDTTKDKLEHLSHQDDSDTANGFDKLPSKQSFLGERREKPKPPDIDTAYHDSGGVDSGSSQRSSSSPPYHRPSTPPKIDWIRDDAFTPEPKEGRPRRLSMVQSSKTYSPATPSPTAIPLVFRKPPVTGAPRSSSVASSPSLNTPKPRKARPSSVEFRSNEFRPLWLVTQYQPKQEFDPEEILPSLPSSHSNSRSSSIHEDDRQVEEVPVSKFKGKPIDTSIGSADVLDSEQTTPTAASYRAKREQDLLDEARQEAVAREIEWNQRTSPESKRRSQETPTKSQMFSSRDILETAGLITAAGAAAAVALSSSKDDDKSDLREKFITLDQDAGSQDSISAEEINHKQLQYDETTRPHGSEVLGDAHTEHVTESPLLSKDSSGNAESSISQLRLGANTFDDRPHAHQDPIVSTADMSAGPTLDQHDSGAASLIHHEERDDASGLTNEPDTSYTGSADRLIPDPEEDFGPVFTVKKDKKKKKKSKVDIDDSPDLVQPSNSIGAEFDTFPADSERQIEPQVVEEDEWAVPSKKKSKKGKKKSSTFEIDEERIAPVASDDLSTSTKVQVPEQIDPPPDNQERSLETIIPSELEHVEHTQDEPVTAEPEEDEWNFSKKNKKKGKKSKASAATVITAIAAATAATAAKAIKDDSEARSPTETPSSEPELIEDPKPVAEDEWESSWTSKKTKKNKKNKQASEISDDPVIATVTDAVFDANEPQDEETSTKSKKSKKRKSVSFHDDPVSMEHYDTRHHSDDQTEGQLLVNDQGKQILGADRYSDEPEAIDSMSTISRTPDSTTQDDVLETTTVESDHHDLTAETYPPSVDVEGATKLDLDVRHLSRDVPTIESQSQGSDAPDQRVARDIDYGEELTAAEGKVIPTESSNVDDSTSTEQAISEHEPVDEEIYLAKDNLQLSNDHQTAEVSSNQTSLGTSPEIGDPQSTKRSISVVEDVETTAQPLEEDSELMEEPDLMTAPTSRRHEDEEAREVSWPIESKSKKKSKKKQRQFSSWDDVETETSNQNGNIERGEDQFDALAITGGAIGALALTETLSRPDEGDQTPDKKGKRSKKDKKKQKFSAWDDEAEDVDKAVTFEDSPASKSTADPEIEAVTHELIEPVDNFEDEKMEEFSSKKSKKNKKKQRLALDWTDQDGKAAIVERPSEQDQVFENDGSEAKHSLDTSDAQSPTTLDAAIAPEPVLSSHNLIDEGDPRELHAAQGSSTLIFSATEPDTANPTEPSILSNTPEESTSRRSFEADGITDILVSSSNDKPEFHQADPEADRTMNLEPRQASPIIAATDKDDIQALDPFAGPSDQAEDKLASQPDDWSTTTKKSKKDKKKKRQSFNYEDEVQTGDQLDAEKIESLDQQTIQDELPSQSHATNHEPPADISLVEPNPPVALEDETWTQPIKKSKKDKKKGRKASALDELPAPEHTEQEPDPAITDSIDAIEQEPGQSRTLTEPIEENETVLPDSMENYSLTDETPATVENDETFAASSKKSKKKDKKKRQLFTWDAEPDTEETKSMTVSEDADTAGIDQQERLEDQTALDITEPVSDLVENNTTIQADSPAPIVDDEEWSQTSKKGKSKKKKNRQLATWDDVQQEEEPSQQDVISEHDQPLQPLHDLDVKMPSEPVDGKSEKPETQSVLPVTAGAALAGAAILEATQDEWSMPSKKGKKKDKKKQQSFAWDSLVDAEPKETTNDSQADVIDKETITEDVPVQEDDWSVPGKKGKKKDKKNKQVVTWNDDAETDEAPLSRDVKETISHEQDVVPGPEHDTRGQDTVDDPDLGVQDKGLDLVDDPEEPQQIPAEPETAETIDSWSGLTKKSKKDKKKKRSVVQELDPEHNDQPGADMEDVQQNITHFPDEHGEAIPAESSTFDDDTPTADRVQDERDVKQQDDIPWSGLLQKKSRIKKRQSSGWTAEDDAEQQSGEQVIASASEEANDRIQRGDDLHSLSPRRDSSLRISDDEDMQPRHGRAEHDLETERATELDEALEHRSPRAPESIFDEENITDGAGDYFNDPRPAISQKISDTAENDHDLRFLRHEDEELQPRYHNSGEYESDEMIQEQTHTHDPIDPVTRQTKQHDTGITRDSTTDLDPSAEKDIDDYYASSKHNNQADLIPTTTETRDTGLKQQPYPDTGADDQILQPNDDDFEAWTPKKKSKKSMKNKKSSAFDEAPSEDIIMPLASRESPALDEDHPSFLAGSVRRDDTESQRLHNEEIVEPSYDHEDVKEYSASESAGAAALTTGLVASAAVLSNLHNDETSTKELNDESESYWATPIKKTGKKSKKSKSITESDSASQDLLSSANQPMLGEGWDQTAISSDARLEPMQDVAESAVPEDDWAPPVKKKKGKKLKNKLPLDFDQYDTPKTSLGNEPEIYNVADDLRDMTSSSKEYPAHEKPDVFQDTQTMSRKTEAVDAPVEVHRQLSRSPETSERYTNRYNESPGLLSKREHELDRQEADPVDTWAVTKKGKKGKKSSRQVDTDDSYFTPSAPLTSGYTLEDPPLDSPSEIQATGLHNQSSSDQHRAYSHQEHSHHEYSTHIGEKRDLDQIADPGHQSQASQIIRAAGKVGAGIAMFEGIQRAASISEDQPPKKSRRTSNEKDAHHARSIESLSHSFEQHSKDQSHIHPAYRDSAVHMDSPVLPSNRESIRDSGFQEDTSRPLNVSIEVDPGYEVTVSSPTGFTGVDQLQEELELPTSRNDHHVRDPSPIDATTRERSAALFSSSPSTRAEHSYQSTELETPTAGKSIFGGPMGYSSDRSLDRMKSPPLTPTAHLTSSQPLTTITETSPDDIKHNRGLRLSTEAKRKSGLRRVKSPGSDSPRRLGLISTDDLISKLSWPDVDEEQQSIDLERSASRNRDKEPRQPTKTRPLSIHIDPLRTHDRRSVSIESNESINAIIRSSPPTATPPLRRVDRSLSSDLRSVARIRSQAFSPTTDNNAKPNSISDNNTRSFDEGIASSSTYDPVNDKGKGRLSKMADVYEGYGDMAGSPHSPTRPSSIRRRQSLQVLDLETRLDQVVSENRLLVEAKNRAERSLELSTQDSEQHHQALQEAIQTRDQYLQQKDEELASLRETLQNLQAQTANLHETSRGITDDDWQSRYQQLEADHDAVRDQLADQSEELDQLRNQHSSLSGGMEAIVANEVRLALQSKEEELQQIQSELESAKQQVKALQQEILAERRGDIELPYLDEDYFEAKCEELCKHVQSFVLRYSKFSDMRICRRLDGVQDEEITDRFDNAILDGSDVDVYLGDRIKRRDVFMSVVMSIMWHYIFTRYLFGMDREQRSKLKSLEKTLTEVGSRTAVNKWRATTLTLLSRRETFHAQREQDIEAVVTEILRTLGAFLPPPPNLRESIMDSLRKVVSSAVDLSIEMRTQKAEYIMLAPLQPAYNLQGDVETMVYFNPASMSERSGNYSDQQALQNGEAIVRLVLFPLVIKQEEDNEQTVIYQAQAIIVGDDTEDKGGRKRGVMSTQDINRSAQSFAPSAMEGGMF